VQGQQGLLLRAHCGDMAGVVHDAEVGAQPQHRVLLLRVRTRPHLEHVCARGVHPHVLVRALAGLGQTPAAKRRGEVDGTEPVFSGVGESGPARLRPHVASQDAAQGNARRADDGALANKGQQRGQFAVRGAVCGLGIGRSGWRRPRPPARAEHGVTPSRT